MLISLNIENLILIRKAEIHFGPGLNILTGETGSGKSAVLTAIRWICGERADPQQVRKEASLAVVEAALSSYAADLLNEEGIAPPPAGQPLHIRREVHVSGKSRCFIEDQQTTLSFLRKCVGSSIERVDQSSSHTLSSSEEQRKILDLYAGLVSETASLARAAAEEQIKESEWQALLQTQTQKERELEWAQNNLTLIQEVDWQPGEEEKLAQEHHLLTHAQELAEKIGAASAALIDSPQPIVPLLKRLHISLESCGRIDPKLAALAQTMKSALLELEETGLALQSYNDRLEADPRRLEAVEQRIAAIESIKRRFGTNEQGILPLKEKLTAQIDRLTHLDTEIETRRAELEDLRAKNREVAETLSRKRKAAAGAFAEQVLEQVKKLNLPHARFAIAFDPKPFSANGIDSVRFLFSANPGLHALPLDQCASGGEQSRLLLAIKTILAEKEKSACLIFDEIDSNVGGQTAAILGDQLKQLAASRQVICVTHFVQVARCATHHFLVSKTEENGSASTLVSLLKEKNRETEYSRMLGQSGFCPA